MRMLSQGYSQSLASNRGLVNRGLVSYQSINRSASAGTGAGLQANKRHSEESSTIRPQLDRSLNLSPIHGILGRNGKSRQFYLGQL
jgi:hypothetical protein